MKITKGAGRRVFALWRVLFVSQGFVYGYTYLGQMFKFCLLQSLNTFQKICCRRVCIIMTLSWEERELPPSPPCILHSLPTPGCLASQHVGRKATPGQPRLCLICSHFNFVQVLSSVQLSRKEFKHGMHLISNSSRRMYSTFV